MKKGLVCIFCGILCVLFYFAISALFTINDLGLLWEMLKNKEPVPKWTVWTVILYRILIYTIPAFFVSVILKLFSKDTKRKILVGFCTQFTAFIIVKAFWHVFALDYLLFDSPFDKIDSFIVLSGLLLAVLYKDIKLIPTSLKE